MKDIPPIEILPKLSNKCILFALSLTLLFLTLPAIFCIYFWYEYDDILLSLFIFIFLQIVSGIILSKIRSFSTPNDQTEINYTTYEILKWYVYRHICNTYNKTLKQTQDRKIDTYPPYNKKELN